MAIPSPEQPKKPRSWRWAYLTALCVVLVLVVLDLGISASDLKGALGEMGEYLSRYTRPDFSDWCEYMIGMGQTVAMAVWGTVMALVLAALAAPLAARNLSPNRPLYYLTREALSFLRAMPDLLLALIFVSAVGLGPLPGIIALGLHTAGFLGKFCSEHFERVPRGVYEALHATGSGYGQRVMYAAWPSVAREAIGYTLYILDRNIRMACVLGLVGAGGIGIVLQSKLRVFEYRQASAIILIILVTILAIDYASTWLRGKLR